MSHAVRKLIIILSPIVLIFLAIAGIIAFNVAFIVLEETTDSIDGMTKAKEQAFASKCDFFLNANNLLFAPDDIKQNMFERSLIARYSSGDCNGFYKSYGAYQKDMDFATKLGVIESYISDTALSASSSAFIEKSLNSLSHEFSDDEEHLAVLSGEYQYDKKKGSLAAASEIRQQAKNLLLSKHSGTDKDLYEFLNDYFP